MPSFTELKERLAQCGFQTNTLNELLEKSASWPATTKHYMRFVALAYKYQPQPDRFESGGGYHLVRMHRSWRPKSDTAEIIKQYLGINHADFARIRLNWVLTKEGEMLVNPDFHFLHDVQSGRAPTDPLDDAKGFVRNQARADTDTAWWESAEVGLDEPDWPDDPPPVVDSLTAQFSVNLRTFNLRSYSPHQNTVKWLVRKHCVPKSFIFSKPMILDSFVSHVNQQWLPRGWQPNERWRFVEHQFCQWVLERFPKFCTIDDEAAFEYAVARYAKDFKLSGETLTKNIAGIIVEESSIREAAESLHQHITETETN